MTGASASAPHGEGYTAAMRAMHWASASLLAGSYLSAWVIPSVTSSAGAARLTLLHHSFGLANLALTAVRLAWRQRTRVPALPPDMSPLQRLGARANVIGLYTLLVVQPMLGLSASMLHGDRLTVLGGLVLPDIVPVDRKLAHVMFGLHGTVALLLLALIGMHLGAALYHHFVRRDDVLAGMLPGLPWQDSTASRPTSAPR